MLSSPDWVWYTLAAAVGLPALLLLYWALLRDRSRGRRRCPKCWYDMTGTPGSLTCSECGYIARRERKLFKTRRRVRWAGLALFLLALALSSGVFPHVQRNGIERYMPTTVLVYLAPDLVHPTAASQALFATGFVTPALGPAAPAPTAPATWQERCGAELARRVDGMWAWQWRWLFSRTCGNKPPWSLTWEMRDNWPADVPFCVNLIAQRDSKFDWLESSDLRITVRPASPDGVESSFEFPRVRAVGMQRSFAPGLRQRVGRVAEAWDDPSIVYGVVADGKASLQFEIIIERRAIMATDRAWQQLWKETVIVPRRVHPAPLPLQPTDESDLINRRLRQYMAVEVNADCATIRFSRIHPEDAVSLPTLAVNAELLHDGRSVATTRAWWTTEENQEQSRVNHTAVPHYELLAWDEPLDPSQLAAAASGEWWLRLTSDPIMALRDLRSTRYWSGEIMILLNWHEEDGCWRNER